jgi:hypothetical protein
MATTRCATAAPVGEDETPRACDIRAEIARFRAEITIRPAARVTPEARRQAGDAVWRPTCGPAANDTSETNNGRTAAPSPPEVP